ncbi:MAG: GDP-mannose 4,6-dehydratase [Candidatus Atribacteria bacterium]|nr:GDP-mannose 4,6-dehydratase [Candidatus Atribacteria bacterium]
MLKEGEGIEGSYSGRGNGEKIEEYKKLITFVPDRPGHDRRYALSSAKLMQELGWKPKWPFADALRHTVRWYITRHG